MNRKSHRRARHQKVLRALPSRFVPWCALGLLVHASSVWALDPTRHISQYAHKVWTIRDGYLPGRPLAIGQTQDGYLWIGTYGGLVRFDGVSFTPWNSPGEGQPSYSSAGITALMGARDGSLWIAAELSRGHPSLSRWKGSELVNYALDAFLPTQSIIQTRNGDVWIGRPFCRVNGTRLECPRTGNGQPTIYNGSALAQDAAGHLWLGGDTRVTQWSPSGSKIYAPAGLKSHAAQGGVLAIAPSPDGSVWVGIAARGPGLGLEHVVRGQWTSAIAPGVDSSNWEVGALLLDRQGALWVGTLNDGVYRLYAGKIEHYGSSQGLSNDTINSFYEDREGDIWVATGAGLDRFRDTRVTVYSQSEGICTAEVDSVLAAQDGTLWIGGDQALIALRGDQLSCIKAGKGLPGDQVTSLFEDQEHHLWVGIDDGMTIFERGRFIPIRKRDGTPPGLIVSIAEDTGHDVWLLSGGGHRALYRIRDREVQEELTFPGISPPHQVAADPQGGLWLGLFTGDLARYRNGHIKVIHFNRSTDSVVNQISVSSDDTVLAATGSGLLGWKKGEHQILTARNGLPCDAVSSFVRDNRGALWLQMRCGFVEIARRELQRWWNHPDALLKVRVLDTLDGMQPGTAPFQGSAKTPDGRLWFANEGVLQMIEPGRRLESDRWQPPIHVEELIADQKHYLPGAPIDLPPRMRNLEIDYTAPSFAIPERVRFRYQLEGRDPGWQEPVGRRQAFYSDLGPGHYTFRVIASNADGVWDQKGASLDFTIAPAYWQTSYFRALCVLVFFGLLWVLYRLRLRQLTHTFNMTLNARVSERTRVARDLHDTLLQSFQGLLLQFRTAQALIPKRPADAQQTLESAIDQARAAINEGRSAVQGLRPTALDANDFTDAIRTLGEELAKDPAYSSSVALTLSIEGRPRALEPLVRDEIYRIAGEAIRNSYRHADASHIEVLLGYGEQRFELRVRDDGKGIPVSLTDDGARGHYGLRGMRERAQEIGGTLTVWSAPGAGTEIELGVPGAAAYGRSRKGPGHWLAAKFSAIRWQRRP